ncbi:uncharacterized protein LOC117169137 [Belonocnema kinseyi]|uniref:uncharacterized protein LOC117169137 n=1 Tax=Belonocnema kinseyi TaxID=2817044 RepID=UPI00143CCA67|nr:uncharacterized protein LOC117169137 [Belonocnema kinseyi]
MGTRRSSSGGGRGNAGVLKERANMSFMLVVMFFAVFGVIVLTEIFLIDERHGSNVGNTGALGGHRSGHRLAAAPDRPDYEEVGAEDYTGLKGGFDDHVGLLVHGEGGEGKKAVIPPDPRALPSLPPGLEARLPRLDQSLRVTHAEWLPVTNTRFKFFVYSAYFDDRIVGGVANRGSPGLVRVIGATKTRSPERVWCRLWYPQQNANITSSITVPAKVKVIRENWNLKYSACFVICPIPKDSSSKVKIPETVSIVARLRAQPTNRILVQNRPIERPVEKKPLAICVKPLHYDYNRVLQLVEFIELYRLLGGTHVTLYNDTVGPDAGCALRYYEQKGYVTLLPWHHLDMISQREIRTEGLFAALNDCLYRSMYTFEYVALVDLDEFIIPRHDDTIVELIRWMGTRISTKSTGAFSFQNAFFYLQWADDPYVSTSRNPIESGLITLRKTRRRSKLHPHKQRSKYVCKPREVVEAGNHFVWEFIPGHGTVNVPSDAAILHHYRVCEFGGDDCIKTQSLVDRSAYKYLEKLAENVDKTWKGLNKECPLPDLKMPLESAKIKTNHFEKTER